ncbi:hypothetical protein C7S18_03405 [Ahniella affigens]|uniref:Uncharacterized protein n=1 Tax=Ahniella affigens TaxID=2021234 RepID=A0A2P1PN82_9GAMM|nr:hypothetical protein C7S18_03405 [Ahniella affigens]
MCGMSFWQRGEVVRSVQRCDVWMQSVADGSRTQAACGGHWNAARKQRPVRSGAISRTEAR